MYLLDAIGGDLFGNGVTAEGVTAALKSFQAAGVKFLNVYVNSPGGDCFEGMAIFNGIQRFKSQAGAQVVMNVDGLAASAASYVAMAGDEVVMAPNSMLMVHNPWAFLAGDADAFRAAAGTLDKLAVMYVDAYCEQSGQTQAAVQAIMRNETWMSSAEAVAEGFADRIATPGQRQDVGAPSGPPMPGGSAKKSRAEMAMEMRSWWHKHTASGAADWKIQQMAAALRRTETQHLAREMRALVARGKNLGGN
jgi:ATP-dependent Clp protease, protease subunit